jgi:threonine/homoserine/homoserine lactone efflux protein
MYQPPDQPYPPQQQWPAAQPPYVMAAKPPYDGLAIASFVLGLVWLGWLGSILAVIFGHVALRNIRRTRASGQGLAIAGLILGYLGVATRALVILFAVIGAAAGGGSDI